MNAPRLEIALDSLTHNARTLVDRLSLKGIRVAGVAKATLGSPEVAAAMVRGGVTGLADSRLENLTRLHTAGFGVPLTLIRSPMLSQVGRVVREADLSFNTEAAVLDALSVAAAAQQRAHGVVLMVELGDLREGIAVEDVVALARSIGDRPGLSLAGLGTNLACQCGVVPDQRNMDQLSELVEQCEVVSGYPLSVVSGGNSANIDWALNADDVGRVNELRLGEAILLGTEPLHRRPIDGLHVDAFSLFAEVIEVQRKPAQPWGNIAQSAFGDQPPRPGRGTINQAILAIGRQDTDPDGLTPPAGITILGMSSDHLVVNAGDHDLSVGDELEFNVNYSALVGAMTSPFVTKVERLAPRR